MALSRKDSVNLTLTQGSPASVNSSTSAHQVIVQQAVTIFRQQLERAWNRQRTPQRLKKKLLETCAADSKVTARIFLDYGGFQAWFAYFLATEGKAHYKGRHDKLSVLAAFARLTSDEQTYVAKAVAGVQPHNTVSGAIDKISRTFANDGSLFN
jgi:hypothetical protein